MLIVQVLFEVTAVGAGKVTWWTVVLAPVDLALVI